MPALPFRLAHLAAIAALALSGSVAATGAEISPPWTHTEERCSDEGACATFRCNDDGDHCTRVSDWRFRPDSDRSYYYSDEQRWSAEDKRSMERCTGHLCATYRCSIDGDDCVRMSGWRWRN